jgi:hypothetical protein
MLTPGPKAATTTRGNVRRKVQFGPPSAQPASAEQPALQKLLEAQKLEEAQKVKDAQKAKDAQTLKPPAFMRIRPESPPAVES